MREVILAKSAGFCFGVRRAVELAQQVAQSGQPYVMLGPVIHNDHVIADLEAQGVRCVASLEEVPPGVRSDHPLPRRGEGGLRPTGGDGLPGGRRHLREGGAHP